MVFYYNVVNNIISANFNDFLPVLSVRSHTYPIRNPQRQLPKHSHEYIKLSCRYQLTVLSNEIFSITGKYYNTIIAKIFGNVGHIPIVSLVPVGHTGLIYKTFRFSAIKIWNSVEANVSLNSSYTSFKTAIKCHLLGNNVNNLFRSVKFSH